MSSIITSLTPNQVTDELNKMQLFIQKEAEEKAKEIRLKADQEYEIKKTALVREETNNIDATYEARLKHISMKRQIDKSHINNKTRLQVLAQKDEVLQTMFDGAREALAKLKKDKKSYKPVLTELVLETLVKLLERSVELRFLEDDVPLAKEVLGDTQKRYKDVTGKDIELKVNEQDYLNEDCIGGLIASADKISIDNTFKERLTLLTEEALPAIKLEMFGPSSSRKFFD